MPGGRAQRVVQIVELDEQDFVEALLSHRLVIQHSLGVVTQIASYSALAISNELFLLILVLLIDIYVGIVLLK